MKTGFDKHTKKPQSAARNKLIRAVASSTAIETGESSRVIEQRLKSGHLRFKNLKLA